VSLALPHLIASQGGAECCQPSSIGPAVSAILIGRTECIFQKLSGCDPGHHDHGPQGDVLQKHGHALIVAIPGHHLGLGAKILKIVFGR
jgi:hypothetical protein